MNQEVEVNSGENANASLQQLQSTEQELRAANQKFRASKEQSELKEQYYQTVLNSIGDPVFVKDAESRLLLVNDAFCEIFGRAREDLIGLTLAEEVAAAEREKFLAIDREVIATGRESVVEETLTVRGGRTRTISTRKSRFKDSAGTAFLVGVIRDISDRKQAEADLQNRNDLLNETGRAAKVGGWQINLDGQTLAWTPETFRIHELSTSAQPDVSEAINFYHPDDRAMVSKKVQETIETGKPFSFEARLITAKGNCLWVAAKGHSVIVDNKAVGVIGSIQDITERKESEKRELQAQVAIERAKRLESMGVLAGGVAHDLNNSLSPLVSLPDMILDDLQKLDGISKKSLKDIEKLLNMVRQSAQRSAEVVKGLLHLSKRGQFNLQPMDLNTAICVAQECERCTQNIQKQHTDVTFTISTADHPLMIMADRAHLDRAIINLVRNAHESIEGNGAVSISTSSQQIAEPMNGLEIVPPGNYAVLEVKDTGHGISAEQLDHIFEPFYSRKMKTSQSGSGLGLSTVHGIVKDHSGFIDVESKVMEGTTFTLYFPLVDEEATLEEDACSQEVQTGPERILIVDDEKALRFTLKMGLQRFGYDATAVSNGREAVALFAEAAKANKESPFDLVLLDMTMEIIFDGLDTYRGILELYPDQKVIIVSGHADGERLQTALDLGADFLPKPYTREELAIAVRKRLDKNDEKG